MGNSLESYEDRIAGLSPDQIRDYIELISRESWCGQALDLGTGAGGWLKRLNESQKFSKLYCSDLKDFRDDHAKQFDFFKVDLANESIPLEEACLDYVFAIEVIEHIENPRKFIREIYRLLKPGGCLVMSTPNCDSFRSKISMLLRGYFPAFCQHDYEGSGHITPITKLDYYRIINEAGFSSSKNYFGIPGQMPSLRLNWQSVFPFLNGHLWSDNFINIAVK